MPETRLDTLARRVLEARREYEDKRKAKTKAEEKKDDAERALHDELVKQKMPSATLDLGPLGRWTFGRRSTIRSRIIDRETAIKSLAGEGKSDGYVVTELRKAPLNELVRERLETGEALPDGIDFSETKYVQATKKK